MDHVARDRSVSAVSVLRDVAAVGVFVVKVCPFVCCRVYAFVSCVAYVWTRGRAWLRGRERRDAQPSWRVCAPVFVRPHVFV